MKKPVTHRSLALESRLLYQDYIDLASSTRVVDLSTISKKSAADSSESKVPRPWMRKKDRPSHHIEQRRLKRERLSHQVKELLERAVSAGVMEGSAS